MLKVQKRMPKGVKYLGDNVYDLGYTQEDIEKRKLEDADNEWEDEYYDYELDDDPLCGILVPENSERYEQLKEVLTEIFETKEVAYRKTEWFDKSLQHGMVSLDCKFPIVIKEGLAKPFGRACDISDMVVYSSLPDNCVRITFTVLNVCDGVEDYE